MVPNYISFDSRCRQECCHTCWPSRHWDEWEASLFRPSEQVFFQFLFFCINVKEILIKKGWSDNLVSDRSNKWCIYHSRNSLSGSRGQLQPTTLMCATQIHSGDTRTYVSVRELVALHLWERLEFLSPSSPRFKPASRDRVSDTNYLEARLLTVALAEPIISDTDIATNYNKLHSAVIFKLYMLL